MRHIDFIGGRNQTCRRFAYGVRALPRPHLLKTDPPKQYRCDYMLAAALLPYIPLTKILTLQSMESQVRSLHTMCASTPCSGHSTTLKGIQSSSHVCGRILSHQPCTAVNKTATITAMELRAAASTLLGSIQNTFMCANYRCNVLHSAAKHQHT